MFKRIIIFLILGVILLATMQASKTPQPITMNSFFGLNANNELQLKLGESPDMADYRVTMDYKLQEREGFKSLINPIGTNKKIIDMWHGHLINDIAGKNYIYYLVYYQTATQTIIIWRKYNIEDGTDAEVETKTTNALINIDKYKFFNKNGYLYIYGYLFYKYGGGATTSTRVIGTTPLIFVNCTPNYSSKVSYQPINLLTLQRKVHYTADGTSTWYYWNEQASTIDSVTINGVGTGAITHSGVESRLLFSVAPTIGQEVVITYTANATNQRNLIENCQQSMFYGGANDTDLFVWGNPNHPNTVYHTYGGDVEFFGIYNYRTFGDGIVTDVVAQGSTQVIFTDKTIYSAETTIASSNVVVGAENITINLVEYTPKIIRYERGNKQGFNVQIIDNNATFLSSDNAIWQLYTPTIRNELNIKYISARVQKTLSEMDLIDGINFDWENKGEYWLVSNGIALIWNYRNNTWYKFTNIYATSYCLVGDELYFGTSGGAIAKFDDSLIYDSVKDSVGKETQTPITAYWTSPYMGYGADFLKKTVNNMYVTLTSEEIADTYLRLEYWTSDNQAPQTSEFQLEKGSPPKQFYSRINARNFTYIKYKFISDRLLDKSTILNFTTTANFGGYVR